MKEFRNYHMIYPKEFHDLHENKNIHRNRKKDRSNHSPLITHKEYEQLDYIAKIEGYYQDINNLIPLNDLNYLTSENNEFCIKTIGDNNDKYKKSFKKSTIDKMFFSSGILIFSEQYTKEVKGGEQNETIITYSIKIGIANNNGNEIQYFSCDTHNRPHDFYFCDDVIISVGRNSIELFKFNISQLSKISEIKLNDNNNNDNNDDKYNILCIERANDKIICGHASGHISIWQPINEYPYLKNTSVSRIHLGPINKIIYEKNSDNLNTIISCSSDKTVKVHSIEDTICLKILQFKDEVLDIKKALDFNKQVNYLISLKNGIIKVYNALFKKVFGIPCQLNKYRLAINIYNNNNSYILISEGNKVKIYKWKNIENNRLYQN